MTIEVWENIKDYSNYQVSNLGRVKSLEKQRILGKNKFIQKEKIIKQNIVSGYNYVYLYKKGKVKGYRVHRLVAQAFLDNSNNYPCINHKDENKQNNCVDNLEWCNHKYNNNYGNFKSKIANAKYKKINQYDLEGNFIKTWNSVKEASEKLNIINTSISKCLERKRNKAGNYIWRYANENTKNKR